MKRERASSDRRVFLVLKSVFLSSSALQTAPPPPRIFPSFFSPASGAQERELVGQKEGSLFRRKKGVKSQEKPDFTEKK